MGLNHPGDLDAWRAWQLSTQPGSRRWRERARSVVSTRGGAATDSSAMVARRSAAPDGELGAIEVLVVLDSVKATSARALLEPLRHLDRARVAVIAPESVLHLLPAGEWVEEPDSLMGATTDLPADGVVVVSTGDYLPFGAVGRQAADLNEGTFVTVQHGLLTPQAPPLAEGTTLLAFSDADADFWRSGRDDVTTHTVGSQLLWDASLGDSIDVDAAVAPVFLGQLHGAELPRDAMARSAEAFCIANHAAYRPHPSETDRTSRRAHERFEKVGIEIDRSVLPLTDVGRPVVSAFSTGVLEAAARGIPAWVHYEQPPAWLGEFWDRYGLAAWGGAPTAPPARPTIEPARAIADHVLALLGEST